MLANILFFVHYSIMLLFGLLLSFAFSGITLAQKKNNVIMLSLFVVSGLLQLFTFYFFSESLVWKIYPLITHLPLFLVLYFVYKKRFLTALAAFASAYLCCQPSKWMGLFFFTLTDNLVIEYCVRILVFFAMGYIALRFLAPVLSILFAKDIQSNLIFGSLPIVYYIFDYATKLFTTFQPATSQLAAEFLSFFLCFIFLLFCFSYYQEHERKSDAERREQIISIAIEQQEKKINAVRRTEQEIRLLRHDMRLFLNNLSLCIENQNYDKALEMLSSYSSHIEGTKLEKYCENDIINYVLSDFANRAEAMNIAFHSHVEVGELTVNELLFSSVLSNILDNALNAQETVAEENRKIYLMLKYSDRKLLLSVKNTCGHKPDFVDGLPVTSRKGHGYGTQSIRYMTERLGGNCQFMIQNDFFVTRIII